MIRLQRVVWCTMIAGLVATPSAPSIVSAQSSPDSVEHRVFTARDGWRAGAFAMGIAVALPFDRRLANQFAQPAWQRNSALANGADAVRVLGDPGAIVATAGSYLVGRLTHHHGVADAGLHATEAVLISGVITKSLKPLIGRARPLVAVGQGPREFRPFSGDSGYTAFPSGHTTVAFAAASVFSAELRKSRYAAQHPRFARAVAPVMFGLASLVGASRLYQGEHWASDVIAGAGVGTVTGLIIARRQHTGPPSRIERWLLPPPR